MYHSVYFDEKNSWDDWHLIPSSRPVINPPAQKRTTIDLPGADGIIDISTALTGFPVYSNRTGSIEFIVENGHDYWYETYSGIMDYLHGKEMLLRLEDDMAYFYRGNLSVNAWASNAHYSTITINYDLEPYKESVHTTCEDWIWDPFNFKDGIMIQQLFKNIEINSDNLTAIDIPMVYYDRHLYGRKPSVVSLTWAPENNSNLRLHFVNDELSINIVKTYEAMTDYTDPDIIVSDLTQSNTIKFYASGTGLLSIDYRLGRL